MAVTSTPYGQAVLALGTGAFNFSSDTLKVILVGSGYTPNVDTHDFLDDVTNELATAGGYTSGGVTLSGVTWQYNTATNAAILGCNAVTWSAATFTGARYAVVFKSTGTAATSRLICYTDFATDQSPNGVNFTLDWSAGGLLTMSVV